MTLQSELLHKLSVYQHLVAIEEAGNRTSYHQLLSRSEKIAACLLEKKLSPGAVVGIALDNITDTITAVIGVLLARCTFVLIDNRLPESRLTGMIGDLEPAGIIADRQIDNGPLAAVPRFLLADLELADNTLLAYPDFSENDSAYIYFTSGSTGKPKGIIGRNDSLIQFLNWEISAFDMGPGMRFSQLISPYFDAFMRDVFVPLLSGGTVCIPPKEEDFFTFGKLSAWLETNQVNVVHCVPSVFRILNNALLTAPQLPELKYVLMSGEKIIPSDLKGWYATFGNRIQLVNLYGPTETTMIRCMYRIQPEDAEKTRMPIGDPIDDTIILIADSHMQPCKPLIAGDLYIITPYATKGYLKDEALTAQKFITLDGKMAFKTGDKARRLFDGTIELLGREDRQIKLSGIRIELEEIELVLAASPVIRNAVVVPDAKEETLSAYVILQDAGTDWEANTDAAVRAQLPAYMVPARYIDVAEFPLLANGKIDYKALVEYRKEKLVVPASNDMEVKILDIWKSILGEKEISVDESFQKAGGNSLGIMRLIAKIFSTFNVRVMLSELFSNITIQQQAVLVTQKIIALHLSALTNGPAAPVQDQGPIRKAGKKALYKTSSIQKGLFFQHQLNQTSASYNFPSVMVLPDQVDKNKIRLTLHKLIDRHAGLRTSFELIDGELFQRVADKVDFDLQEVEIAEAQVESTIVGFIQPFDLAKAPLLRVLLIAVSNGRNLVVVDMPHIISDQITRDIMVRDFKLLFEDKALPELPLSYVDFAEWQQSEENNTAVESDRNFWLEQFAGEIPVLEMPLDYPRPAVFNFEGNTITFDIDQELNTKLDQLAEKEGTTKYILYLAVYNLLLHKLTNQEDIVIGTSSAGRKYPVLDQVAGVFINILGLRNQVKGDLKFRDFLQEVKRNTHLALDHQDYPFNDLINALNLERDQSRNALFDVMLEYHADSFEEEQSALDVMPYKGKHMKDTKFDLSLHIHEGKRERYFSFTYCTALFSEATVKRFIEYFSLLIASVVNDPNQPLSRVRMIPDAEVKLLTKTFNNTEVAYERDQTIVSLFEAQVLKSAQYPALCFKGQTLTYHELNCRVNQLAAYLTAQGATTGSVVGLMLERSHEMVIGILAILKTGAAYLPLDPWLPEKRIGVMMEQSHMMLLLSEGEYVARYAAYVPAKDIRDEALYQGSDANPGCMMWSKDLAYTIFTSGSTGVPKGVMMSHRGVVNLVKGLQERVYNRFADERLRVGLLASYSFDASVQQIFPALLGGHCLYICGEEDRKDGAKMLAFYNEQQIDISDGTPTHLRLLADALESAQLTGLRSWILAGELLPKSLVKAFYAKVNHVRLYNFYGPTETCVDSTGYEISVDCLDDYPTIPIGRPLANERVYITDDYGNLTPLGVTGELCIAGDGLAQRYTGDWALTIEKFASDWVGGETRVYRTGDLCRWLPDGNIAYHGRKDAQIKLRGYRVELSEIAHRLQTYKGVRSGVVQLREVHGEDHVIAYYVADEVLTPSALRAHMLEMLPEYMVPSYFVHLPHLPQTVNGKIDYQALPDVETGPAETDQRASNETEEKLVAIWSDVLKLDKESIGVYRSFFELGGHSLKLVYLANRLKQAFSKEFSLAQLIALENIRRLAAAINGKDNAAAYEAISKAETKEYYHASSGQQRLYFLHEFDRTSLAYNLAQVVELEGVLELKKLELAFSQLIARHESLRTSFRLINGEVYQQMAEEVPFELELLEADDSDVDAVIRDFIRPFDLSNAPLLRAGLIRLSATLHVLVVDMHHIITDGVSQGILIKDFMSIYNGQALPALTLQYKDYAEWQRGERQQQQLETQRAYWMQEFAVPVSVLDIPTDDARLLVKSYAGANSRFALNKITTDQLKRIGDAEGATMFMTLLSLFNVLLSKLSNQEDICIGTPVAGRNHADLEGIIGVFINTLVMRNNPAGELRFSDFLRQVKAKSLQGFEHQSYQYEELISALNVPRDTGRNPLFDVLFVLQNTDQSALTIPGLKLSSRDSGHGAAKFDLTLIAEESPEGLVLHFEYATALFRKARIEKMIAAWKRIVGQVVANPDIKLSEIDILSREEREQLLVKFNTTQVPYPHTQTIMDLFAAQVQKSPDRLAVTCADTRLTYSELHERSEQVAGYLREVVQISKGDRVGVLLEREPELLPVIFGIMKSGGVYVPLSVHNPAARTSTIIANSGMKVLMSRSTFITSLTAEDCQVVDLETSLADIKAYTTKTKFERPTGNDLAYIIYTSGSTGTPKGVMIEHHAIVNRLLWMQHEYPLTATDVLLQKTPLIFDVSVWELFWWSITGASLCLLAPDEEKDPRKVAEVIERQGVTVIHFVPTMLHAFLTEIANRRQYELSALRIVFASGEALGTAQVKSFGRELHQEYGTRLVNLYGPTEATVDVSYYECAFNNIPASIPIGKPIHNTSLYILNKQQQLSPIGVAGELYIGGVGLSRGYIGLPALTAEKFITSPLTGERLYKTGDLACWLPDGNISYLGRLDDQVKIRGLRIEPGEISHQLLHHEQISEAVTILSEEGDLVAYYVAPDEIAPALLRSLLSAHLPAYMIPAHFVHLKALPITVNGKLDRRALPAPAFHAEDHFEASANEIEDKLVEIWSDVLRIDKALISVTRSFFDMGGDSIKIIAVRDRVNTAFDCNISIAGMFGLPTVRAIQKFISQESPDLKEMMVDIDQALVGAHDTLNLLKKL